MTVRLAMKYSEVDAKNVTPLLEDDNIVVEQKVDGTRALVVITTPEGKEPFVRFLGHGGGALKHTAAMQHFRKIAEALKPHFPKPGETVIDGEVMIDTGMFVPFDLPYSEVDGEVLVKPEMPYIERLQMLTVLTARMHAPVRQAKRAFSRDEKEALFEQLRTIGAEGVMAKRLDSAYEPGRRVKHSVKVKFVKTADVIVKKSTRSRNSAGRETGGFTFEVYVSPGVKRTIGSCSAIGKPHVEVGDVIEVKYLYRAGDGALVQPRMLKVRTDKTPEECTIDQFPAYSKQVL